MICTDSALSVSATNKRFKVSEKVLVQWSEGDGLRTFDGMLEQANGSHHSTSHARLGGEVRRIANHLSGLGNLQQQTKPNLKKHNTKITL